MQYYAAHDKTADLRFFLSGDFFIKREKRPGESCYEG